MNNTVMKTIDIIQLISQNHNGLSLSEITNMLKLPKSTVFNIVTTLVERGILRRSNEKMPTYQLGIEALKIGLSFLRGTALETSARPILSNLCYEVNETVFMSVKSGASDLVYILKFLSTSEFQTICSIGTVRPLLSVAMGKAMLSAMTDEEIKTQVTPEMFEHCSSPDIKDMSSLLNYIHESRKNGYVTEVTIENPNFANTVAAPVRDVTGELTAAVSIVIMHDPHNKERIASLGKKINQAALEISRGLGYLDDTLYPAQNVM